MCACVAPVFHVLTCLETDGQLGEGVEGFAHLVQKQWCHVTVYGHRIGHGLRRVMLRVGLWALVFRHSADTIVGWCVCVSEFSFENTWFFQDSRNAGFQASRIQDCRNLEIHVFSMQAFASMCDLNLWVQLGPIPYTSMREFMWVAGSGYLDFLIAGYPDVWWISGCPCFSGCLDFWFFWFLDSTKNNSVLFSLRAVDVRCGWRQWRGALIILCYSEPWFIWIALMVTA